jgi:hypothetical protein
MHVPLDNADFSRKTADRADDESDPLVEQLRRLIPYHPLWNDPVKVKQFQDSLRDAMTMGRTEAKGASEEEIARLRQSEPENRDDEFIDGPEGAMKWNRMRKNL